MNGKTGETANMKNKYLEPEMCFFSLSLFDVVFGLFLLLFLASLRIYPAQAGEYFDPHNHLNGILPFEAYANLPSYIQNYPTGPNGIKQSDLKNYYSALYAWEQTNGRNLGDQLYAPNQRFGLGARTTLALISPEAPSWEIKGALERVLTATPWTEFDNAYAFRGDPTDGYLQKTFYPNPGDESKAILEAIDLELARTHIMDSEQSMNFIGGWRFKSGHSSRLETIKFFMGAPQDPVLKAKLKVFPKVKILLMTHAAELGEEAGGKEFSYYSAKGCVPSALTGYGTKTLDIKEALLGNDSAAKPVISEADLPMYFNTVVGIDTAGPELECMTNSGMEVFKRYALAVYQASKERRKRGWNGKLLVHTHVGEGGCIYGMEKSSFGAAFGAFPNVTTSASNMPSNISHLLSAIQDLESAHSDLLDYVVFRLGHVTWATMDQAVLMGKLKVEADVNLESNVATGAYPRGRMPEAAPQLNKTLAGYLVDERKNWELNDLLGTLIPNGQEGDLEKVGEILGNASLKYLLENHVPVLLGTDGAGVEHSNIQREYVLADSLVRYWKKHDPVFVSKAANAGEGILFEAVKWHQQNMAANKWVDF